MSTTNTDLQRYDSYGTYGDIRDGDHVLIEGHRMIVSDPTRIEAGPDASFNTRARIEFIGRCADPHDDVKGTAYDGGTYGGYENRSVTFLYRAPGRSNGLEGGAP
jgi:hypothetical protein